MKDATRMDRRQQSYELLWICRDGIADQVWDVHDYDRSTYLRIQNGGPRVLHHGDFGVQEANTDRRTCPDRRMLDDPRKTLRLLQHSPPIRKALYGVDGDWPLHINNLFDVCDDTVHYRTISYARTAKAFESAEQLFRINNMPQFVDRTAALRKSISDSNISPYFCTELHQAIHAYRMLSIFSDGFESRIWNARHYDKRAYRRVQDDEGQSSSQVDLLGQDAKPVRRRPDRRRAGRGMLKDPQKHHPSAAGVNADSRGGVWRRRRSARASRHTAHAAQSRGALSADLTRAHGQGIRERGTAAEGDSCDPLCRTDRRSARART